jgi:hypothetical protein
MEETLEDGTQVVHLGSLDNIKWTDFECASFTLLRGEQRLKKQVKKQKEVIDKSIEYINQHWVIDEPVWFKNDLLDILKGEKQE